MCCVVRSVDPIYVSGRLMICSNCVSCDRLVQHFNLGTMALTFWYFSDTFVSLGPSLATSFPNDSFSTSARGLEPPFFAAGAVFAFLGGVCDIAESLSSSSLSEPWPPSDMSSSSSLSGFARFLEAVAFGFPVKVVWVIFFGAALEPAAAFLGAALALGF